MGSLADFRQQYPQYDSLSDQELTDRLYNKFYAGKIDRDSFNAKIGFVPEPIAPAVPLEPASPVEPVSPHRGMAAMPPPDPSLGVSGLIDRGNINLRNRPQVKNGNDISTVRSITIGFGDKTYVLPTVSDDGRLLTNDEAVELYRKTGKHLGVFDTLQHANQFSNALHQQQENYYKPNQPKPLTRADIGKPAGPGGDFLARGAEAFGKGVAQGFLRTELQMFDMGGMTAAMQLQDRERALEAIDNGNFEMIRQEGPAGEQIEILSPDGTFPPFGLQKDSDLYWYITDPQSRQGIIDRYRTEATKEFFSREAGYNKRVQNIERAVPMTEEQQQSIPGQVGSATGQMGGFMIGAPLGAAGVLIAGSNVESRAMFEDALDHGADLKTAMDASALGAAIGTTELVPIEVALNRLDKATGGWVKRTMLEILRTGTAEGAQEFGQTILENLSALKLYDPNRDILEQAPEAGGLGGAAGAIMAFVMSLLPGREHGAGGAGPGGLGREPGVSTPGIEPGRGEVPGAGVPPPPPPPMPPGGTPGARADRERLAALDEERKRRAAEKPFRTSITVDGQTYEFDTPEQVAEFAKRLAAQRQDQGIADAQQTAQQILEQQQQEAQAAQQEQEAKGDGTKDRPITVETPEDIRKATTGAASSPLNQRPEPTDGQKEAGNYKKTHLKFPEGHPLHGMNFAIETPKGGIRKSKEDAPVKWESPPMPADYGYAKRTEDVTGEPLDVFFGDNPDADMAYVIDQIDPETDKFDEPKSFIMFGGKGQDGLKAAVEAYIGSFSDNSGPSRIGAVTSMSLPEWRTWAESEDAKKSAVSYIEPTVAKQEPQESAGESTPTSSPSQERQPPPPVSPEAPRPSIFPKAGEGAPGAENAPPKVSEPTAPIAHRPVANKEDVAITPSGNRVGVRYAIVDARDVTPSHLDDLSENPSFPQELQPRERGAVGPAAQVARIAGKPDPLQLDDSNRAESGAPIISPSGIVESGNGRMLGLRRAYELNPEAMADYIAHLKERGYPIEGIEQPVLVRVRTQEMTPEERVNFVRDANKPTGLSQRTSELAMQDAKHLTPDLLSMFQGGSVSAVGNAAFVRKFIEKAVTENEAGEMMTSSGNLSIVGIRRVEAAFLARAFGNRELIEGIMEDPDEDMRSVGGALLDVSIPWAKMRGAAEAGSIDPTTDLTADLMDAVALVRRVRRENRKILEFINQDDLLTGRGMKEEIEAFVRLLYNEQLTRGLSRQKIGAALKYYTDMAMKTNPVDMLGTAPKPVELVEKAKESQHANEQQDLLAKRPPVASPSEPAPSPPEPPGEQLPKPSGGRGGKGGRKGGQSAKPPKTTRTGNQTPPVPNQQPSNRPGGEEGPAPTPPNVPGPAAPPKAPTSGPELTGKSAELAAKLKDLLDKGKKPKLRVKTGALSPTEAQIEDLKNRFKQIGLSDKAVLKIAATIRYVTENVDLQASGLTDWREGVPLIVVALDASDTRWTLNHEIIHVLRGLGLITPTEWSILEKAAKADTALMERVTDQWGDLNLIESDLVEEAIAEMFGAWAQQRPVAGGSIRMAFQRIKAFFKALTDWLRGIGITTADQVFERIESGKVGRRPINVKDHPEMKFAAAWHGGPHDFGEFDINKIGTGEGAQAYGWGLYFTDKAAIAKYYRDKLSREEGPTYKGKTFVKFDGKPVDWNPEWLADWERDAQSLLQYLVDNDLTTFSDILRAKTLLRQHIKEMGWFKRLRTVGYQENLLEQFIDKGYKIGNAKTGKLYKVDLAPAEDEYLLWDTPLVDQPEKVRKALYKVPEWDKIMERIKIANQSYGKYDRKGRITGETFYKEILPDVIVGRQVTGGRRTPSQRERSEWLKALGIRGIKYLAGDSRGRGEGNYNYVIFDAKDVRITKKFQVKPVDPEVRAVGTELAQTILESGPISFTDFANQMSAVLAQPIAELRPYLRSWYNGGRDAIEDSGGSIAGIDTAESVSQQMSTLFQTEQAPPNQNEQQPSSPPPTTPPPGDAGVNTSPKKEPKDRHQAWTEALNKGESLYVKQVGSKWAVSGKGTFKHRETLKRTLNGEWRGDLKEWRFDYDPTEALGNAIWGDTPPSQQDLQRIPQRPGSDDPAIQSAHTRLLGFRGAPRANERGNGRNFDALVGPDTKALIQRGIKIGMPEEVVEEQIIDTGMIVDAFETGKPMFMLANEAGTGKTFVLGAAIRELRKRGHKKFIYVTMNQKLIEQIKNDLDPYEIGNVQFVTYSDLDNGRTPDGAGSIVIWDESHQIINTTGARGREADGLLRSGQWHIFSSATPYANPAQLSYLAPTGLFDDWGGVRTFMLAAGAQEKEKKISRTVKIIIYHWNPTVLGSNENAKAVHDWLMATGLKTQRSKRLPKDMVSSAFRKLDISPEWLHTYTQVESIYTRAMEIAGNSAYGDVMMAVLLPHRINTLKRILESAKIEEGVDRARKHMAEGKQVVIFTETKAERMLGVRVEVGPKNNRRLLDIEESYQHLLSEFTEWANTPYEDRGPWPFNPYKIALAQAYKEAGYREDLPSVADAFLRAFGRDNTAVYTGPVKLETMTVSSASAAKDLEAFEKGEKQLMLATMGKGGTGLSIHPRRQGNPRVQIGTSLPWSPLQWDQTSGRLARYGLQSPVEIEWLVANNVNLEQSVAQRIGSRLQSMGATVKGIDIKAGQDLAEWEIEEGGQTLQAWSPGSTPFRSQTQRFYRGLPVRRGAEVITSRLRRELEQRQAKRRESARSGREYQRPILNDEEIQVVNEFIDWIGREPFQHVAVQFVKGRDEGPTGEYNALSAIVTIFDNALLNGRFDRTAVHELWHSLERHLTREMYLRLVDEYRSATRRYIRRNNWFGWFHNGREMVIPVLTGRRAEAFLTHFPNAERDGLVTVWRGNFNGVAQIEIRPRATEENYRFWNHHEYFAETMSDKYFDEKEFRDEGTRSIWRLFKRLFREMTSRIRRVLGIERASDRIFRGFQEREFLAHPYIPDRAVIAEDGIYELPTITPPTRPPRRPRITQANSPLYQAHLSLMHPTTWQILVNMNKHSLRHHNLIGGQMTAKDAFSKEAIAAQINSIKRIWMDRMLPFQEIQRIIENLGRRVSDRENVKLMEEGFTSKVAEEQLQFLRNFQQPLFETLRKLQSLGVSHGDVEWYLYALHAFERNKVIANRNPQMPDGGSGLTNAEAKDILQQVRAKPRQTRMLLNKVRRQIQDINEWKMSQWILYGLETAQTVQDLKNQFRHYVPLKGMEPILGIEDVETGPRREIGSGLDIKGKEFKVALGRQNPATDILAYVLAGAQDAIIRGQKNLVGQSLMRLVANNPDPTFWQIRRPSVERWLNPKTGLVEMRFKRNLNESDRAHSLFMKSGGKPYWVWLADLRTARAMNNIGADEMGWLLKSGAALNRWLSFVNTGGAPEFIVTNLMRDLQTSFLQISGEQRADLIKGFTKNLLLLRAHRGALRGLLGYANTPLEQRFRQFMRAGGKVSFWNFDTIEDINKQISHDLAVAQGPLQSPMAWTKEGIQRAVHGIEYVNQWIDTSIRFAAFLAAQDAGLSDMRAAHIAKHLTVNFNQRGEAGKYINAMYLFGNASLQGAGIIFKRMKSKWVRRAIYGMVAGGLAQSLLQALFSPDDDKDGISNYDELPEFFKTRNVIYGDGHMWPMPLGYNVFWDLGRNVGDYLVGRKTAAGATTQWLKTAFEGYSFLGTGGFLQLLAPTAFDPVVDLATNRNFMETPIVPETDSNEPQDPRSQQSFTSNSETSKALALWISDMTQTGDIPPGAIDIYPGHIDYLVGEAFGGLGNTINDLLDVGVKIYQGDTSDLESSDIPFVRRVYRKAGERSEVGSYYDTRRELEQIEHDLKAAEDRGDDKAANAIEEKYALELDMLPSLKAYEKELAASRKSIRDEMKLSGEEQDKQFIKEEKAAQREIMREFNKEYAETVSIPRREERAILPTSKMRSILEQY